MRQKELLDLYLDLQSDIFRTFEDLWVFKIRQDSVVELLVVSCNFNLPIMLAEHFILGVVARFGFSCKCPRDLEVHSIFFGFPSQRPYVQTKNHRTWSTCGNYSDCSGCRFELLLDTENRDFEPWKRLYSWALACGLDFAVGTRLETPPATPTTKIKTNPRLSVSKHDPNPVIYPPRAHVTSETCMGILMHTNGANSSCQCSIMGVVPKKPCPFDEHMLIVIKHSCLRQDLKQKKPLQKTYSLNPLDFQWFSLVRSVGFLRWGALAPSTLRLWARRHRGWGGELCPTSATRTIYCSWSWAFYLRWRRRRSEMFLIGFARSKIPGCTG